MLKRETGTVKRSTQSEPAMEQPTYTEYGVTLFTHHFQAKGKIRSLGHLQTFMNNEQKPTFVVYGAEAIGFDPGNPATRVTPAELIVRKPLCHLIAFDRAPPTAEYTLLPHVEPLAVYTERFAIQGVFHMGQDAFIADFADSSLQQFLAVTDARIYPLFQPRAPLMHSAPLALVQRSLISMYHKVGS